MHLRFFVGSALMVAFFVPASRAAAQSNQLPDAASNPNAPRDAVTSGTGAPGTIVGPRQSAARVGFSPGAGTRLGEHAATEPAATERNATERASASLAAAARNGASGRTLAIVGGAAFLGGLIIGGSAGTAIAVGGLAVGVWGLYLWMQ